MTELGLFWLIAPEPRGAEPGPVDGHGPTWLWAAAVSLFPHPVHERDALALREELGIQAPLNGLGLMKLASNTPNGIRFHARHRRLLMEQSAAAFESRLPSVLGEAVRWWQRRMTGPRTSIPNPDWESDTSPEGLERRLVYAVLELRVDKDRALSRLEALAQAADREVIAERIRDLVLYTKPGEGFDIPFTLEELGPSWSRLVTAPSPPEPDGPIR